MRWLKRPELALAVAIVALAGTWGGPAVAGHLITSKDVRDRSLRGKDLRSNTITGRIVKGLSGRDVIDDGLDGTDILERSLGTVPRASRADTASDAGTVGGSTIRRAAFTGGPGTGATTVLEVAGLRIEAACSGSNTVSVTATATGSPGFVRVTGSRPDSREGTVALYAEDDELTTGDQFNVLAGASDDVSGTLTWFGPGNEAVTLPFLAESGVGGRPYTCVFAGAATVTPGG